MSDKALVIDKADLDKHPWYYTMELEPGVFSAGQRFPNVALTRELLSRTSLEGQRCLDIGTMEGLIPILMTRRGAAEVVAYDRPSAYRERVNMVKATYEANFEFVSGFEMTELRKRVAAPFDVVTLSGVLYHMFSPLTGLAIVRGLVREGGIAIIETAAALRSDQVMYFNNGDRFTGCSYFLPSLTCLDYMVRFLRMSIIDCEILRSHKVDGIDVCRAALVCRAEATPIGDHADTFLQGGYHTEMDIAEHVDWQSLRSDAPPVPYQAAGTRLLNRTLPTRATQKLLRLAGAGELADRVESGKRPLPYWLRDDCASIDIYKMAAQSRPFRPRAAATQLALSDMS